MFTTHRAWGLGYRVWGKVAAAERQRLLLLLLRVCEPNECVTLLLRRRLTYLFVCSYMYLFEYVIIYFLIICLFVCLQGMGEV